MSDELDFNDQPARPRTTRSTATNTGTFWAVLAALVVFVAVPFLGYVVWDALTEKGRKEHQRKLDAEQRELKRQHDIIREKYLKPAN